MAVAVNEYGARALANWRRQEPGLLAQIPDRQGYFTALGVQVRAQVTELTGRLAGPDRPGETGPERAARLAGARTEAEEIVMAALAFPPPVDPQEDRMPPVMGKDVRWEDRAAWQGRRMLQFHALMGRLRDAETAERDRRADEGWRRRMRAADPGWLDPSIRTATRDNSGGGQSS